MTLNRATAQGTERNYSSMLMQSYVDYEQSMNWGPLGRWVGTKGKNHHGFRPMYKEADVPLLSYLHKLYKQNSGTYIVPLTALIEADLLELLSLRQLEPQRFPGSYITIDEKNKALDIQGFVYYYFGGQNVGAVNNRVFLVPTGKRFYSQTILKSEEVETFKENITQNLKNLVEAYLNPTFQTPYNSTDGLISLRIVFQRLSEMSHRKLTPLLESPIYPSLFPTDPTDATSRIAVFKAFQKALEEVEPAYPEVFEWQPIEDIKNRMSGQ